MSNTYVAIMAGGIGSRFWPESRVNKPKQFLDILGVGKTLIQSTYDRFLKICPQENIYIVTNETYVDLIKEQLTGILDDRILAEPQRRNTAPCVAYVSNKIHEQNPNANLVVAPSDHIIMDEKSFSQRIETALNFVDDSDTLITLGIKPTRPDTGYGYIQFEPGESDDEVCKVKTFTEKPDLPLAKTFVKSGDFLWNSGIFVWSTQSILRAFEMHQPEMHEIFRDGVGKYNTDQEDEFISKAYSMCTNISIDYGIMENAENVYVIPSEFGWSDLGTWASLYERYDKDYLGNAVNGDHVKVLDATNCMVMAPPEKLVVLQGLHKFIVIDTEDVLLICEKSKEQQIKQITSDIKQEKGDDYL